MSCDYSKTQALVGDHMLLKDFRLMGHLHEYVYSYHHDNAVTGLWVLWNNIFDYGCSLLYIFPLFLTGDLPVRIQRSRQYNAYATGHATGVLFPARQNFSRCQHSVKTS
jgi:hypothetical protein